MSDRELILNAVQSMPENASMVEILDELRLLQSVKQGLDETGRGQITPHKEVVKRMEEWIAKSSIRGMRTTRRMTT